VVRKKKAVVGAEKTNKRDNDPYGESKGAEKNTLPAANALAAKERKPNLGKKAGKN